LDNANLFASKGQFSDNAPMQPRLPRIRRTAAALIACGALGFATALAAQTGDERSLACQAGTTVRDAASAAWQSAQTLSSYALGLLGVDYKFGGNTPESGLDCSGLVHYVFQQVTGISLPRSAREMSLIGDRVAVEDLKPGDLVFFNTRRFEFSHVGIYLGDNQFIHAPRRGREVEVAMLDKRYWQQRFNGARRLVGVLPGMIPPFISEAQAKPAEPPAVIAPAPVAE
jgi:cell wall-associated NlpC family hydrolase